jgi:hypothetical protein
MPSLVIQKSLDNPRSPVTFYGSDLLRLESMVQDYFELVHYLINTPVPYDTPVRVLRKRASRSNHPFSSPALRRSGRRKTATATRNHRGRKAA